MKKCTTSDHKRPGKTEFEEGNSFTNGRIAAVNSTDRLVHRIAIRESYTMIASKRRIYYWNSEQVALQSNGVSRQWTLNGSN